jgi:ribosomal protein bL25 (Ctc-form)
MELRLVAERREGTGKGVARKLRAAGRVPAVVYGQGMESTAVSVDAKELFHVLHAGGANVLLDVVLDGEPQLALARDVQRDHIRGRFVHVDFLAVSRTEKITIAIPSAIGRWAEGRRRPRAPPVGDPGGMSARRRARLDRRRRHRARGRRLGQGR